MAAVYSINPLQDSRWETFLETQPHASAFHSRGWLEAIDRTYDYKPVVFTTSSPTETLKNALLFASVRSWLTGRRIVSLPFSDHCEPLFDSSEELNIVLSYLQTEMDHQRWKYIEVRAMSGNLMGQTDRCGFRPAASYHLHRIDLQPKLQDVFQSLDKDSVQRRIRHAERAGLIEKSGRGEDLLKDFYHLTVLTRKRQQIPPQPYGWFQNVLSCLGEAAEIRMAYTKEGIPAAGIWILRYKNSVIYKYGCSDERFKHLGATVLLLWRAIENAKENGAIEFDLGRSEESNRGLVTFKDKWTSNCTRLTYWRYPPASPGSTSREEWKLRLAKLFFARLPNSLLTAAGRAFYRHMG